ncbi:hypothetical protein Acsp03_02770 [Actinomadura sp. NBRC 104412]|uniref:PspC domain-containing protein n=1 Tax=Actinomadura sp. NBRC 104412 TaxID=3032203 RepID=UPI0024A40C41|nr:PspC domain-containing protein [Actinomadura sp. NBRC 104412]GLZ02810.1 hypothetical protein Acsp03_02770 [Actinomadura sp. NBRC 104412]
MDTEHTEHTEHTGQTGQTSTAAATWPRRVNEGRMIAGVCAGAARHLGIDVNVLRLGLAALAVVGTVTSFGGAVFLVYAAAWALIPAEGRSSSIAEDLIRKANRNATVQEVVRKTKEGLDEGLAKAKGKHDLA